MTTEQELIRKLLEKDAKGNIVKDNIVPIGTLIIALLAVLSALYGQYLASETSLVTATIRSKQVGYAKLITTIDSAGYAAIRDDPIVPSMESVREAYYSIELLVPKEERDKLLRQLEDTIAHLEPIKQEHVNEEIKIDLFVKFNKYKDSFRESLQHALE